MLPKYSYLIYSLDLLSDILHTKTVFILSSDVFFFIFTTNFQRRYKVIRMFIMYAFLYVLVETILRCVDSRLKEEKTTLFENKTCF